MAEMYIVVKVSTTGEFSEHIGSVLQERIEEAMYAQLDNEDNTIATVQSARSMGAEQMWVSLAAGDVVYYPIATTELDLDSADGQNRDLFDDDPLADYRCTRCGCASEACFCE